MEGTFVALRPMQYGPSFPADMLDLHQVFEMRHEQNDEMLLRLKYVAPVEPRARLLQCGECGRKFTSDLGRTRHGRIRHEPQHGPKIVDDNLGPIDLDDPAQLEERAARLRRDMKDIVQAGTMQVPNLDPEDEAAAAENKLLQDIAPVPWEKTAAAVKAGDAKVPEIVTAPPTRVRKARKASKRRA